MFSEIGVLKNFPIFLGNHMYWSFFLITQQAGRPATLLKKRLQNRCLPENIAKLLRTAFYRTPPAPVLCDDSVLWTPLDAKLIFSYFLCHFFAFLHKFSVCNFQLFCAHYNIGSSTILVESLKFRNSSRVIVTFLGNLL